MRIARKDYEDQAEVSALVSLATNTVGESLTVQSQCEDADINTIMRKYGLTGRLPENVRVPTYGDFEGINDYKSALLAIREADEAFMEIPADKRALFDNDPQRLLEFVYDEANSARVKELFGERIQTVKGADRAAAGSAAGGREGVSDAAGGRQGDGSAASSAGATGGDKAA